MPELKATIFKDYFGIHAEDIIYSPRDVAMLPTFGKIGSCNHFDIVPVHQIFKPYRVGSKAKEVFIQMSDGIGDYFFFSAVCAFLENQGITVHMYVDRSLWPVMDWFKYKPVMHHFIDPVLHNYKPFRPMPERLDFEYVGVQGRDKNWIECLFDHIGFTQHRPFYFLRPYLIDYRLPGLQMVDPASILVCHRASSPSRSSTFEDFYIPIRIHSDLQIYVHQNDMTRQDMEFLVGAKNVTVIPKVTIRQYLMNVYDAAFVVTTDSSALHFREGVQRPALGVYASMEAKSRTSGYMFTRSFNVKSDCPLQPCYFHQVIQTDRCDMFKKEPNDTLTAKCQTGQLFQQQLTQQLWDFLK